MAVTSAFVVLPGMAANLPLELPRDFAPIGFVSQEPMLITAVPSLEAATLPQLSVLAKKRPGEISYASTGRGTLTHLTGELLQTRADIRLLMVPYLGGQAQALNDIMSGRVPLLISALSAVSSALQAGSLKALAVASAERLPSLPNLPMVAETIPGFRSIGWNVLLTPVATPEAIVRKVNEDLRKVLDEVEVRNRIATMGAQVRSKHMSPGELAAFIQEEQQLWNPVLQQIASNP
jgi:tripartite-type tricarboxylate transporter receptor subunit TctC